MAASILPNEKTSVYRYYDDAGALLYVGITNLGLRRNSEHNLSKEWWPFVASQKVDHYDTRKEALRREAHLIRLCHPPFNVVHNQIYKRVRAAYLAMRAVGTPVRRQNTPPIRALFQRAEEQGRVVYRVVKGEARLTDTLMAAMPSDTPVVHIGKTIGWWRTTTRNSDGVLELHIELDPVGRKPYRGSVDVVVEEAGGLETIKCVNTKTKASK